MNGRLPLVGFVVLSLSSLAMAQSMSALMSEAMDKQVKLELAGPLPKAMQNIGSDTSVRIEADPAVWAALPWGEDTTITAHIENQTLREALAGITQKLGLNFEVKDQFVLLKPSAPLRRLGRRATVDELHALDVLAATPLQSGDENATVKSTIAAIDAKLKTVDQKLAVDLQTADQAIETAAVIVPRNATLADALEAISTSTHLTWYPWGNTIVVLPKEDQIRNQLSQTISVRYSGVELSQVLNELQQAAGVDFIIQPGAIARVPADARKINLLLDNASVRQALETISGVTGVGYVVNDKGVYLWNQTADQPAAGARDPILGSIQLDGMQVFIPTSAVPPDVRDYVKYKTQQQFDVLRKKMTEENFKPSTQPAQN